MTDTPGATPPFSGFPGFPPGEMLERMWDMMRLTPFGSAFSGAQAGSTPGLGPSLSMMSDMMAPLTNVEELDKRITDMRAVEQWLKLNLSMLQSAIQALEVQRATLATLRAFGAFAQTSMSSAAPLLLRRPGCRARKHRRRPQPRRRLRRRTSRKLVRLRRKTQAKKRKRRLSIPRPGGICCSRNSTSWRSSRWPRRPRRARRPQRKISPKRPKRPGHPTQRMPPRQARRRKKPRKRPPARSARRRSARHRQRLARVRVLREKRRPPPATDGRSQRRALFQVRRGRCQ